MDPILQVKDLDLWYGAHQALHSVSMGQGNYFLG